MARQEISGIDRLWEQYKRTIKDNGAIILFSQMPFTAILACSNLEMLKYEWIWQKEQGSGFLNANHAPLKTHENILVFSNGSTSPSGVSMCYNPQKTKGEPYQQKSGKASKNYDYKNMVCVETINNGDRFPIDVIKFNRDKSKVHPTQKPVSLLEYIINTYSNENDLVLDNCMGSGTTGVACKLLNRNFIGIEKE